MVVDTGPFLWYAYRMISNRKVSSQMEQLYQVFNSNGEMIAFAARVEFYGDGTMIYRTGSCSGPTDQIEPTVVGTKFTHWQYGDVKVIKINPKTIWLETPDGCKFKVKHTL